MANKHPTSFMNERSLEYFIIPKLIGTLSPYCKSIAPIFFWKTREGGKASCEAHRFRNVRIVAFFARRPKFTKNPIVIEGKINHEIIRFAQKAQTYGIPTIAGFCAAKSLFDLEAGAIHWISITHEDPDEDILFFEEENTHKLFKQDGSPISTIQTELLAGQLLFMTHSMPFNQGIETMSDLRHELSDYQFFWGGFGSAYKPVYLLIEE